MIIEKKGKKEVVCTETKYYCDLCGKELGEKYIDEKKRIEIQVIKEYSNYGFDGGYEEGYAYDFCIECFEKEIKPFLDKKCNPRYVYLDW